MQQYQGNKECCCFKKCSGSEHVAVPYVPNPCVKYENQHQSCNSVPGLWCLGGVQRHQQTEVTPVSLRARR